VSRLTEDSIKLKAAIEFGSDYTYGTKNGGLGPTLVINAPSKKMAGIARKKIPTTWEGLYTLVVYTNSSEEEDLDIPDFRPKIDLPV
tara:strand:+ start:586 stop:846 length:261 start_codon:yes stop_codon:yes gene_type:complete